LKLSSPNDAYWVGVGAEERAEVGESQPKALRFRVSSPDVVIYVFNERPKLLQLTLKDHYPNFVIDVRWINEKLLFASVWWGRVLGTDLILDVENESIVYKEMLHDGLVVYRQWQKPPRRRAVRAHSENRPSESAGVLTARLVGAYVDYPVKRLSDPSLRRTSPRAIRQSPRANSRRHKKLPQSLCLPVETRREALLTFGGLIYARAWGFCAGLAPAGIRR